MSVGDGLFFAFVFLVAFPAAVVILVRIIDVILELVRPGPHDPLLSTRKGPHRRGALFYWSGHLQMIFTDEGRTGEEPYERPSGSQPVSVGKPGT